MTNQSEEIRNFINDNPGASTEQIIQGTGWNRYLVETALKLMTQSAVIQEVGRTDRDDPKWELIVREPKGWQEVDDQVQALAEHMSKACSSAIAYIGSVATALGGPFSVFAEAAIEENARLEEEEVRKRVMEQQPKNTSWFSDFTFPSSLSDLVVEEDIYAFIVTVPGNERLAVKAADCYTDEGSLVFEDDNDVTIMIIAPGHWVKVERAEDDQNA